ncbi:hypothetical protein G6F35_014360 [Rhizopus arrhizus]|nr:hypothetical protein G6F35_014360 [Rhizopus arrhizus]
MDLGLGASLARGRTDRGSQGGGQHRPDGGSGRGLDRRGVGAGRHVLLLLRLHPALLIQLHGQALDVAQRRPMQFDQAQHAGALQFDHAGVVNAGELLFIHDPEAAQVAVAVGLRDGDRLGGEQAQLVQALGHVLGQLHFALEHAQEFHHLRQVAGFLAVFEQGHAVGGVDAGVGLIDAYGQTVGLGRGAQHEGIAALDLSSRPSSTATWKLPASSPTKTMG